MTGRRGTIEERFWPKVMVTDGCWLWRGALTKKGYGWFRATRESLPAHRVAYELTYGPIHEGLEIDHLCHIKACVNPTHLEAVPRSVNLDRRLYDRIHCSRGHRRTSANTVRKASGGIAYCKECRNDQRRARYAHDPCYRQAEIARSQRAYERGRTSPSDR